MPVATQEEPKNKTSNVALLIVEAFLARSKDLKEQGLPQPAPGFVKPSSDFRKFSATEVAVLSAHIPTADR
jgi:hypothetical protein